MGILVSTINMLHGRLALNVLNRLSAAEWPRRFFKTWAQAEGFGRPATHERMLLDTIRCRKYQEAVEKAIRGGEVVIDLGAGTALLSCFAVRAGASRVYALEMSRIADVAEEVIRANGFQDRITVVRGHSSKAKLPERADLLVTETLSEAGFDNENIIEVVADARRRLLKPDARVIPQWCDTLFTPVETDALGLGALAPSLYGLDYAPLRQRRYGDGRPFMVMASGKPFAALAPAGRAFRVDLTRDTSPPGLGTVEFKVERAGRLDAFLGWFETGLVEGVTLSNSPDLPPTSWNQLYFPVLPQPRLQIGQAVRLEVDPRYAGGGSHWHYRVLVDGRPVEQAFADAPGRPA
jgi:hypothetical protein